MSQGLLNDAEARGTVYTVAMDEVKFLPFRQQHGPISLGTKNLNSCSTAIIVSIFGAILAHIPPRPMYHTADLEAGDRHAQEKMDEVATLYWSNRDRYFPAGGNNWVLCAVFHGEVALPDQQKIMQDSLAQLGLASTPLTYQVERERHGPLFPGKGTVFIEGSGPVPVVYVEDKVVSRESQWLASPIPAEQNMAFSSGYFPQATANYPAEAGSSQITSQEITGPYYYVQNKEYFLYDKGQHIYQPQRPKDVWVLNEQGWKDGAGQRWRYWDGKNISYSA